MARPPHKRTEEQDVSKTPSDADRLHKAQAMFWRFSANELLMLVALLIVVLGTWGFIEVADNVVSGTTEKFDLWAVQTFRETVNNRIPLDEPSIRQAFLDISALGGPAVLFLMTSAMLIFLFWDRRYNAMLLVILATFGGAILAYLLKEGIGRPRPDVEQLTAVLLPSFPSGHTMLSAIVYPTLGTLLARVVSRKRLKIYFMLVALGLSGLIGISRVYLGVHYPTDVLAGWAAGLAWAALCWTVTKYLQQRGAVEGAEEEDSAPAA